MKILPSIAILLFLTISTDLRAAAAPHCGEISTGGPGGAGGDYTKAEDRYKLKIVEEHHFTSNIENLAYGNSGTLGGELSYVLLLFPNHHRALAALSKLTFERRH